jgi:hypothetical protein
MCFYFLLVSLGLRSFICGGVFDNEIKAYLSDYKNKQVNSDGSVCVGVDGLSVTAFICFYKNYADDVFEYGDFYRYKSLSLEGLRKVHLLSDDDFVYVEEGYSFLYPTNRKSVGDFIAYEAGNVLCKDDSDGGGRPAICYASVLFSVKNTSTDPVFFVSAIIERPLTPGGKVGEKAVSRVRAINAIIKSKKLMNNMSVVSNFD